MFFFYYHLAGIDERKTYPFLCKDRHVYHASHGKGKGTAIISFHEEENVLRYSLEEFQIVSIVTEEFQLTVVYISSGANLEDVVKVIKTMIDPNNLQMILGDFNFDSMDNNYIKNFFDEMGLHQEVTQPTHQAGRILDHLYLSGELREKSKLNVKFKYFSDHAALQIKFNV